MKVSKTNSSVLFCLDSFVVVCGMCSLKDVETLFLSFSFFFRFFIFPWQLITRASSTDWDVKVWWQKLSFPSSESWRQGQWADTILLLRADAKRMPLNWKPYKTVVSSERNLRLPGHLQVFSYRRSSTVIVFVNKRPFFTKIRSSTPGFKIFPDHETAKQDWDF
jgi:hypothetical protein